MSSILVIVLMLLFVSGLAFDDYWATRYPHQIVPAWGSVLELTLLAGCFIGAVAWIVVSLF